MAFIKGQPRHPMAGAKKGFKKRKAAEARALLAVLDKTALSPWEELVKMIQDGDLRPSDKAKVLMHMTEYLDQKAKPTDTPNVTVNVANVTQSGAQPSQAREQMRAILESPAASAAVRVIEEQLALPPAPTERTLQSSSATSMPTDDTEPALVAEIVEKKD